MSTSVVMSLSAAASRLNVGFCRKRLVIVDQRNIIYPVKTSPVNSVRTIPDSWCLDVISNFILTFGLSFF